MDEDVHVREPCHLCDQTSLSWIVTGIVEQIHREYDYFIFVIFIFLPNRTCCVLTFETLNNGCRPLVFSVSPNTHSIFQSTVYFLAHLQVSVPVLNVASLLCKTQT